MLQQRASDWAENNRSADFLLNITACANAESWRKSAQEANKQPAPTSLQQEFIQHSREAIDAAARAERRRRNKILGSVTAGLIIAVLLSVFALFQMREAKKAQTEAESQKEKAEKAQTEAESQKKEAERLYQEVFKKSSLTKEEAEEKAQQFIKEEGGRVFHDSLKNGKNGPEMVWLPAGEFKMGDIFGGGSWSERPVVDKMSIKRFAIGRYEVTVGEFRQFVEDSKYHKGSKYQTEAEKEGGCSVYKDGYWQYVEDANWRKPYFSQTDDKQKQPVVCVSWNDAIAYTQWLSEQTDQTYRLPSEAEWEYAARAGKEMPYWWGAVVGTGWANCNGCGSHKDNQRTAQVESFVPNLFSLYNIIGNVEEWVADSWHNNYEGVPKDGSVWKDEADNCLRMSRGGGWQSKPEKVRLAYREGSLDLLDSLDARSAARGFRIAKQDNPLIRAELDAEKQQWDKAKLQCKAVRTFKGLTKEYAEKITKRFIEEKEGRVFQDTFLIDKKSKGPEMVWFPAGTFRMGDLKNRGSSDEKPVHEVTIKEHFAIGRYEVTFAEYDKFAEAMSKEKPDDSGWGRDNRPVINVSWNDAMAYAKWLSDQTGEQYELPSEAEWEYAARAGTETVYWWGNEMGENWANCSSSQCGDDFENTSPVGSFSANPFGLYDTVGNVWEWVADGWHGDYTNAPNDGKAWISYAISNRVLRGGSWVSNSYDSRAANRDWVIPYDWDRYIGFRVVRRVARTN